MRGFRDEEAKPAKLVDITATLVRESGAAFQINDGDLQCWVPKSQVEHDGHGVFTMPMWLAEERGFA